MIEIDMKINTYGMSRNVYNVGNIYIANVGRSGFNNCYDYAYVIYEPLSSFSEEVCLHGIIRDYNQDNPLSKLLREVLLDYGDSANELSQQYCDHWLEVYKNDD